jgi:hypothetical protein
MTANELKGMIVIKTIFPEVAFKRENGKIKVIGSKATGYVDNDKITVKLIEKNTLHFYTNSPDIFTTVVELVPEDILIQAFSNSTFPITYISTSGEQSTAPQEKYVNTVEMINGKIYVYTTDNLAVEDESEIVL